MASFIEELVFVLSEQLDLHDKILALTEEERAALISKRPDQVLGLVRRKETLVLQSKTLEESRRLLCMRISRDLGLSTMTPTLREIRECVADSALAAKIEALRSRMLACMASLQEANSRNVRICENGMDIIRGIVQSAADASADDGATGYNPRAGARKGAAGLYRQQG